MILDLTKKELIILITAHQPQTIEGCQELTQLGFMEFCGNQWNEAWRWKKDILNDLSYNLLWSIYRTIREA